MNIMVAVVIGLVIAFCTSVVVNVYVVDRLVEEKGGAILFAIFTIGLYATVLDAVILLI